jgi:hypothetical protein
MVPLRARAQRLKSLPHAGRISAASIALLQKSHEGAARCTFELLGVSRPVIVGVGSLEALLDERKKFILVQSPVVVGVGRGELLGIEPTAQFASVEGAIMIAVELVEQLRGCTLGFGEIDCTVVIQIERF